MSFFKFESIKKLIHVKKACKSFTDQIFRSRCNRIKVRKAIKTVTTFLVSPRQKIRFRSMRQRSSTSHHYHLLQKGLPAIFIDQLYHPKSGQSSRQPVINKDNKEPGFATTSADSSGSNTSARTSGSKLDENVTTKQFSLLREKKKDESRKGNMLRTRDIRGVDERAEDYILKVREQMRLQREQSILDFQEMLARSV
ncbi:hypothetical protein Lser_V15G13903 [Lactuca serriola]